MPVLIADFIRKDEDVLHLQSYKRSSSFDDWKQSAKQQKIIQKLSQFRLDNVVDSPEDLLIKREENLEMIKIVVLLKDSIGEIPLRYIVERYVYQKKIKDIAIKYGHERKSVGRTIRKATRKALEILKELSDNGKIDLDIFKQPKKLYDAKVPSVKVDYPSDSAIHSFDRYYKYNGMVKYKTKCKLPEYLNESFSDDNSVCSLCFTQLGTNNCTRKEANCAARGVNSNKYN